MLSIILLCIFMFMGLKACEHEAQQNEIKNRQWAQDIAGNRHFTNFGE